MVRYKRIGLPSTTSISRVQKIKIYHPDYPILDHTRRSSYESLSHLRLDSTMRGLGDVAGGEMRGLDTPR